MIFLYAKNPGGLLAKHEIGDIFYNEGFRKFARDNELSLPDKEIKFNDIFTTKKYSKCMKELCASGWLEAKGKASGTKYKRAENWPDLMDLGDNQETDK